MDKRTLEQIIEDKKQGLEDTLKQNNKYKWIIEEHKATLLSFIDNYESIKNIYTHVGTIETEGLIKLKVLKSCLAHIERLENEQ